MKEITEAVNARYSTLSESSCCLSCGGASALSAPKEGEICVDLGSGRGTDVIRLADKVGETGFVIGIDVTDSMLEKARQTALKMGVKNVEFRKGELEQLPVEDGVADLVVSNCTINHAVDKKAVWKEIFRILKKGGRFVVSDIYSLEKVPEAYANDPAAVAECWAGAVEKDEYLATVQDAGFIGIAILEESAPYEKGAIRVASFTISGKKAAVCCCSH